MWRLPPISVEVEILVIGAATAFLLTTIVVLWIALREARKKADAEQARVKDLAQALEVARRLDQDVTNVAEFIKEFPRLMSGLHGLSGVREIPQVLVDTMVRVFGAEHAVVLIRGRGSLLDPGRENRLIVTALTSPIPGLTPGTEIPFGEGQLGYVADSQRVMDRQDFERETGFKAYSRRGEPLFAAVAPMLVGDDTIGVLAFAGPHRRTQRGKEMLQIIAQLGAMTWQNMSAFRSVKTAADIDGLTGILNKRALETRLSELVYDARRNGSRVAVFMFDLDHFKNYNDINGHLAGDQLLRVLSQLVRETVRQDDLFGRFGGEEFLLVMPERTRAQALTVAENIRTRVASYGFVCGDRQPLGRVTISGGVAVFPDDADDSVKLIRAADAALYRAKGEGRNRVFEAEPSPTLGG